jgi:PTH1 family peptidyl-tRNA hydrolase
VPRVDLKLVVGLGNPGSKYQNNRHNVGFLIVDRFAARFEIRLDTKKKKAVFGRGSCNGVTVTVLKPQTFMNLSGEAVLYLASFLKVKTQDIIVVADDTELAFGRIRIKKRGGSGGHNGIRSLINSLKSEDFPRLKFGIGRPDPTSGKELCDYVLEDFTREEMKVLEREADRAVDALAVMVSESVEEARNRYNKR